MQAAGYSDLYIRRKISLWRHQSFQGLANSSLNSFGHMTWDKTSGIQYAICWGSNSESPHTERKFSRERRKPPFIALLWKQRAPQRSCCPCTQPDQGKDSALRHIGHGCRYTHSPGKTCLTTLVEALYNLNKVYLLKSTNVPLESEGKSLNVWVLHRRLLRV